jgi:hypothetical protein
MAESTFISDPSYKAYIIDGGLLVTATGTPDWDTHTAKGTFKDYTGTYALELDTDLTHDTPAGGKHRYDIIQLKNDGTLSIKKGAEVVVASEATVPTLDADNILIAEVHVSDDIGSISSSEITDKIPRADSTNSTKVSLMDGSEDTVGRAWLGGEAYQGGNPNA